MNDKSMINDIIANDPEILESFIDESRECLVVAGKNLKCLREAPGKPDPECIEEAFRAVHSLKSAAGFLYLDKVSNLARRMEEMLGHHRGNPAAPGVDRLELLLEGVGMLSDMLVNPMESSNVDTGEFLAKLAEEMAADHDG